MNIELEKGTVSLRKPTAGQRNKALMEAETPEGIKNTVLMVELLPYCVKSHPFGNTPVRAALDGLSIEEYDKLIEGLSALIKPVGDAAKKLEKPLDSDMKEEPSVGP